MNKNRLVLILLGIFLTGDFTFSFIQYYNSPLFGDLAGHVLPDKTIQPVFDDPFGFHLLMTGKTHSNPNRFFVHLAVAEYFQHVPLWLQKWVTPINSVYLASAIAKLVVQLLFVYFLAFFISGKANPVKKNFLIAAAIVIPLFQVHGYWSRMGIVDKSIVYTFFYALPLVLLMLFFLPVFNRLMHPRKIKAAHYFFMIPLIVILPLSGPLIPAVILIVSFLIFSRFFLLSENKKLIKVLESIPVSFYIFLVPASLWSLYSLFLGFYNSNYSGEMLSLGERFARLPEGLFSQVFHSLGFPLMLLFIVINMFLIRKNKFSGGEKLMHILMWVGLFALLYILLLPFGGYRPYRPRIIRYDTFMPVTIALIYFFGASTFFLITHFSKKNKQKYVIGLLLVILTFTISDLEGIDENSCEKMALQKMANSTEKVVGIPRDCIVLDWENNFESEQTVKQAELIHYWNITSEKKLYYNKY